MLKLLQKVSRLQEFAELPPQEVEQKFSAILRGDDTTKIERIEHVANTVFDRLRKLLVAAGTSFQSRDREIETVAAGFISGVPVLLLGPPGTAKSAVVRRLATLCGLAPGEDEGGTNQTGAPFHGGYFEYLLTNHTMPEELFGGPDLAELAKGKIKKVTTGKLPRAEIAFLDEVFRGGGHILNTLLTIINEKRFDSGDGAVHVPLLGLVGASNDIPREPELEAFFDRFPVRTWVRSILEQRQKVSQSSGNLPTAQLINLSVKAETQRLAEAWDTSAASTERIAKRESCTNDFRFARMYLLHRIGPDVNRSDRFKTFEQIFRAVRDRAGLSDRAFGQLWLFAAALDLLRKADPNQGYPESKGHLEVFLHVARSPQDAAWLNDIVTQHKQGMQLNGSA